MCEDIFCSKNLAPSLLQYVVLQCVAVCCSMLQCVRTYFAFKIWNGMQVFARHNCPTPLPLLQCVASQGVAVCESVMQYVRTYFALKS